MPSRGTSSGDEESAEQCSIRAGNDVPGSAAALPIINERIVRCIVYLSVWNYSQPQASVLGRLSSIFTVTRILKQEMLEFSLAHCIWLSLLGVSELLQVGRGH
jgi:hypothetical protein